MITDTLKRQGYFCLWKNETRNGKKTKVPYMPNGSRAKATEKSCFTTYDAVMNVKGYDGIGLGIFDHMGVIDIDHCIKDGEVSDLAKDVINLVESYAEVSPSGTGLHILFKIDKLKFNKTKYYINNRSLGLEVYIAGATSRFITITGENVNDLDIEMRDEEVTAVLEKYMKRPESEKVMGETGCSYLSDDEVIEKASHKNGFKFDKLWDGDTSSYPSHSEADLALCMILAFWCGGDLDQMDRLFRESGLMRDKWDRAQSGSTYGAITLNNAVKKCKAFYSPVHVYTGDEDLSPILDKLKVFDNPMYDWTDAGNGKLFSDVYRDVARFVPERSKWYVYDGIQWKADIASLKVMRLTIDLGYTLIKEAAKIKEEKRRKALTSLSSKWLSKGKITTILTVAEIYYPISMSTFDTDPYLFNCLNGTLNLSTGEFRGHSPDDKLTKLAPVNYNPEAHSDRWISFISEIMSGDAAKADFLQRALGYGLSGDTRYECLFILYGSTTRNGKGTLMESILRVMGDYGKAVRPETIAYKSNVNSQGPSEDIARLDGLRFANISEPPKGMMMNAAQVKSMTGNDTLNARYLHENSFDFKPQFKIYINTNFLPTITDMTLFTSGRIVIIPFERHFAPDEQDTELKYMFREEQVQSAILNWLIEGYRMLKTKKLMKPKAVVDATKAYHKDSDRIERFMEECMYKDVNAEVKTSVAYDKYCTWCDVNGYRRESQRTFSQELKGRYELKRKRPKDGGEKTTMLLGFNVKSEFAD